MNAVLICAIFAPLTLITAHYTGCKERALISGSNDHVSENQLSASSSYPHGDHSARRSRLNTKEIEAAGAWCAGTSNVGQWIQVDFIKKHFVTAIATRGRDGKYLQWVTSYELRYSDDGRTWKIYKEGHTTKIFSGNWDRFTINKHKLSKPFVARYVRLYPRTWYSHMSLRWELFGCPLLVAHCPPGFDHLYSHGTPTYIVTRPYQASCYRFSTDQENWLDARKKCRALGADLVSVETAGEQHHLESVIKGNPVLQKPVWTVSNTPLWMSGQRRNVSDGHACVLTDWKYWGYWTSGTDSPQEGYWRWAATGRSLTYSNWSNGQPDNRYDGALTENCQHMWRHGGYKWNDCECTINFNSYICEIKAIGI